MTLLAIWVTTSVAMLGAAVTASAATPATTEFPVPAGSNPNGIATGPDGNLWYAGFGTSHIGRVTPAGVVTQFFTGITVGAKPVAITSGPDGNLWFAEFNAGKVGRITPAGVVTEFTPPSAGAAPTSITPGPAGELWFTERGANKIASITTDGTITEYATGISPGASPNDIVAGPDGNLWFTEISTPKIGRITPAGVVTEFSAGISAAATSIALGPDGNLWFTEAAGNRIGRITPAGVVTEFSAGLSPGAAPTDIVAGQDGNLWFTENTGARVGRITTDGVITEFSAGITAGSNPSGITSGPDGNLWFAESAGNRLGRINTALEAPAFQNPASIATNDNSAGSPYPSPISVTGLANRRITDVRVRLTGISHTYPDDIDVLLSSPNGGSVVVASDGGGELSVTGITVNLSDSAPFALPNTLPLVSGRFQPTNSLPVDTFPAPAPAGPYLPTLAGLAGSAANGNWNLYVADDSLVDSGAIAGGWGLDIDTEVVPAPTLSSTAPSSPANQNAPKVVGSSEAGSTVTLYGNAGCSGPALGSGPAATLASPGITITVANDSTTEVHATETDANGNVSACSTSSVTYREDSAAPVVAIDSGPSGTIGTGSARFVFSANEAAATFSCSLDGAAAAPCSSPKSYAALADGPHSFAVTGTDAAGNQSAAQTRAFTVKRPTPTAPETRLDKHPKKKLKTKKRKLKVSFEFSSPTAGAKFECKLDKGQFEPCGSPATYKVKKGKHTFSVAAGAKGLTDATPASYSFKVKKKRAKK